MDGNYAQIPDEVILERPNNSAEADKAQELLKDAGIEFTVEFRPDLSGPTDVQAYRARTVVTTRVGSFRGLQQIKEFIQIDKRMRERQTA